MTGGPGRYECDGCGACCRTFPIYASAEDAASEPRLVAESLALAEHLRGPGRAYRLFPLPFLEACGFLRPDHSCDIYQSRPKVCRDFPAGGTQCQEARSRHGLPPLWESRKS